MLQADDGVMLVGSVHKMIGDMLVPGVPLLEKILRPILVYLFLVIILRIFGKRELAQLNPFDLIVLLSLSNTVQNAIIGDDNSVSGGVIGAVTLLAVNLCVVKFIRSSSKLDHIVEGASTVLVEDGKIRHDCLKSELITENDLLAVVRRQGFSSVDDIDSCVLEPNGTFAIIEKKPNQVDTEHGELMTAIAKLSEEVARLRSERNTIGTPT